MLKQSCSLCNRFDWCCAAKYPSLSFQIVLGHSYLQVLKKPFGTRRSESVAYADNVRVMLLDLDYQLINGDCRSQEESFMTFFLCQGKKSKNPSHMDTVSKSGPQDLHVSSTSSPRISHTSSKSG